MASSPDEKSKSSYSDEQRITRSAKILSRKSIKNDVKDSSPSPYKYEVETILKDGSRSPATQRKFQVPISRIDDDDNDDTDKSLEESITRGKTPGVIIDREQAPLKENPSSNLWSLILIIIVVLTGIAIGIFASSSKQSHKTSFKSSGSSSIDCSQFMSLENKFKNQDKKLFKSLKSGIEGMYNRTPQVPSVFTFFSTDDNAIDTLLKEVVKIAKACIKQTHDPINLTIADLASSNFIERYKDELIKRKIMIIEHVDLMPTSTVRLLHSFADTYNPIVSESILYLTVKVPKKPEGKPIDYIQEYLHEKWKDMASNLRDPLITRFLDQTFFINAGS